MRTLRVTVQPKTGQIRTRRRRYRGTFCGKNPHSENQFDFTDGNSEFDDETKSNRHFHFDGGVMKVRRCLDAFIRVRIERNIIDAFQNHRGFRKPVDLFRQFFDMVGVHMCIAK